MRIELKPSTGNREIYRRSRADPRESASRVAAPTTSVKSDGIEEIAIVKRNCEIYPAKMGQNAHTRARANSG